MTHRRRKTDQWYGILHPITQLIIALTALVTALGSLKWNRYNAERLDQHKEVILENEKMIAKNAEATNDVAGAVGLPPLAEKPANIKKD